MTLESRCLLYTPLQPPDRSDILKTDAVVASNQAEKLRHSSGRPRGQEGVAGCASAGAVSVEVNKKLMVVPVPGSP